MERRAGRAAWITVTHLNSSDLVFEQAVLRYRDVPDRPGQDAPSGSGTSR